MDRSLFPEMVEVHQTHLQNTEATRAFHILKRWVDGASMGVANGLQVTVNGTSPTLVDIASGDGYAPNGELIETDAAIPAVSLSNYLVGLDNYVCLVYTENQTHPEASATGGKTRETRAERTFRTRVFTLTELNALPPTAADLTVDARDRTLVLAIVNANGPGVPLTTADLTLPATAPRVLTAPLPVNCLGCQIVSIDPLTPTTADRIAAGDIANSQGHLRVNTNGSPPSTVNAQYRAPGDSTFGAGVVIGGGGSPFTIVSPGGRTIKLAVSIPLLDPIGLQTLDDVFNIDEMYAEPVLRSSARDEQHRRRYGDALVTPINPHALSIPDIAKQMEVPWAMFFGTQLQSTEAQALIPRLLTPQVPTATSPRTYLWEIALDNGQKVRFYVNQFSTLDITINARWQGFFQDWAKDVPGQTATKFSIYGAGFTQQAVAAATAGPWGDSSWDSVPIFLSALAGASAQGELNINGAARLGGLLLGTLAGRDIARVYEEYDNPGGGGQIRSLLFEQRRSGGLADERLFRIYRANTVASIARSDVLEFVFNAHWSTSGNQWVKENGAVAAAKIEFHKDFVLILQRLAASGATFDDTQGGTGWDAPSFTFNLSLGIFVAQGDIFTNGEFKYGAPVRTYTQSVMGTACTFTAGTGITASPSQSDPSGGASLGRTPNGNQFGIVWPLHLPQGAVITGGLVRGNFLHGVGGILNGAVVRMAKPFASAAQTMKNLGGPTDVDNIADGNDVDRTFTCNASLAIRTVDNTAYNYFIWIGDAFGTPYNENFTIWYLNVTYTLDRVSFA